MYKKILLIVSFCMFLLQAGAAEADYNVIPQPQQVTLTKDKPFNLSPNAQIICPSTDELMLKNPQFLSDYIKETTGLLLTINKNPKPKVPSIFLVIDPKIQGDEAYKINVTPQKVVISGRTSAGVFYGIQTLRKSLPILRPTEHEPVLLPSVSIADAPRFPYRGMMLDCSRHFFPISFVKRFIDLIALHNMNVFHWHLTDDQGWRIEIKKYPKLTEIGSKRSGTIMGHNSDVDDGQPYGGFYTQQEAKDIVEYARQRHITVIPEIDMPGHMKAALAAYPELGCTGGPYEVGHAWGVYKDVLCLGNEQVYKFVQDVIDEMAAIFPSKYIHIGGDETPTVRWKECPKCQKLAAEQHLSANKLQAYFTNRIEKYINSKQREIIGWDEILDGEINPSATIMSWRGIEPGERGAKLGHDVIMTPTSHCYFDYKQNENEDTEPEGQHQLITVEKVYSLDPAPTNMPAENRKHILGTQGNLWSEYIAYPNRAEYAVLPRMAALSEVQWTQPEKKDFSNFKVRADHMAKIYDLYKYVYALQLWPERFNHNRSEW